VSITSHNGSINTVADTLIKANGLTLSARHGIGNTGQIKTALLGNGPLSATTFDGDINIVETIGSLTYTQVTTGSGNTTLAAYKDLNPVSATTSLIKGGRITLTSVTGGVGNFVSARIDSGTIKFTDGLTVTAVGNVNVKEIAGDLLLTSISTVGDVTVTVAAGNLIDNNSEEARDTRTETALLGLWDSVRLRGDAALQSGNDQVTAYKAAQEARYRLWWQYRNVRSDGAGGYSADAYDPAFAFHFGTAERALLLDQLTTAHPDWTAVQLDAAITAEEARRTAEYQALYADFGTTTLQPDLHVQRVDDEAGRPDDRLRVDD